MSDSQGAEDVFLCLVDKGQSRSMVEEREERKVSVAESRGREEKESWSGRDERVQEATEEGEIEWRLRRQESPERLRKAHVPPPIQTMFNRGTTEIILSSCITAWFGNCTISDYMSLQRIVSTAEKIIRVSLPSIMDIYTTCCICKANSIVDDPHTHSSPYCRLGKGTKYSDPQNQTVTVSFLKRSDSLIPRTGLK
ncbi:hypothetical protein QTP86_020237 [Hemibagrus guttatus]|nr:hypothetical protein QTP86_020237 [Hemibagrus guttatus]